MYVKCQGAMSRKSWEIDKLLFLNEHTKEIPCFFYVMRGDDDGALPLSRSLGHGQKVFPDGSPEKRIHSNLHGIK